MIGIESDEVQQCIQGAIDMHVHSAPDVMPRKGDDIECAWRVRNAGMAGFVLKSHHVPTADRAALVNKVVPGIRAYGALALNNFVGGMNPMAVEVAGRLGAKVVWMPTVDAQNEERQLAHQDPALRPYWAALHLQLKAQGRLKPPVTVVNENGALTSDVLQVLDLIKEYGMVLATGHLSPKESVQLIREAHRRGLERIVVTHPEFPTTRFTISEQRALMEYGVSFERCYTTPATGKVAWEEVYAAIRATGPHANILSTDLGQPQALFLDDGLKDFCVHLLNEGFTPADIHIMTSTNPANLLD
ncbi:MAG: DUF6282 family protein [Firmicutes bacterium]|nr:DUF6282 family protein [Bacillota bacterium]